MSQAENPRIDLGADLSRARFKVRHLNHAPESKVIIWEIHTNYLEYAVFDIEKGSSLEAYSRDARVVLERRAPTDFRISRNGEPVHNYPVVSLEAAEHVVRNMLFEGNMDYPLFNLS